MNLYLLSQNINKGYDTFSSCVVVAESEEDAKTIHPYGINCDEGGFYYEGSWYENNKHYHDTTWVKHPKNVKVEYLGVANGNITRGVICASFHAG